ncbi:hypothetical protein Droror1_Dr00013329 [Drosera rotundifolia]
MDDGKPNVSLLTAARQRLSVSLEKANLLYCAIEEASSRQGAIKCNLQFSTIEISSTHAQVCKVTAVAERINHAVGPVAAALKVHDTVRELQMLLISSTCHECPLDDYLLIIKQNEEALRFLRDTCELAVNWTEEIVKPTDDDVIANSELNVKRTSRILKDMKAIEAHAHLKRGFMSNALDKLELELGRLLKVKNDPRSRLPGNIAIRKIGAILERLKGNGRLENCTTIYVDARSSSTRAALHAINLNYIDKQVSPLHSVRVIEDDIARWGVHLEFAVKDVLEAEYALASKVLEKIGPDVASKSFARIISQCGFLVLLQFGKKVTETKKDAAKLLKLLEIFGFLNKLRIDFNRLFGGKDCIEVQTLTRELVNKVVGGAFQIFIELPLQIELHRSTPPPSDGSVPRLVMFVTSYCIRLLKDDYRSTLSEVISIHKVWSDKKKYSTDGVTLRDEFYRIMSALDINLMKWSNSYRESAQAHFFLMNNYWYLHKTTKDTKLAEIMGEEWSQRLGENALHFSEIYLSESWGKLPSMLREDSLLLIFPGQTTAQELVCQRLKAFNSAFELLFEKQCHWVVSDESIREMICRLIVKTIVPVYNRFLHNYAFLVAGKGSSTPNKSFRFSRLQMEALITCLFQGKAKDSVVGNKAAYSISKISRIAANRFPRSLITA